MAMTYLPLGAASCLFLGVMVHAVITDFKRRQIMTPGESTLRLSLNTLRASPAFPACKSAAPSD